MKDITVTVSGQAPRVYPSGITAFDIFQDIDSNLSHEAIAARVNGQLWDLNRPLESDAELEVIMPDSGEGHEILLHSTAHLMAQAVKELFPEVKVTIGPAIENRFYYDFDIPEPFSEEDLSRIEGRMKELAHANLRVERRTFSREEAIDFFSKRGEPYKVEIIEQIGEDDEICAYAQGDFVDLCRGPHVPSTNRIKHFKLLNSAGAYWRGDERNKMLRRIYGTAFPTEEALGKYLAFLDEAKTRDHRKLGKELQLFMFNPLSPGSPFFLPKGTTVYNELVRFIRELYRDYGYQEVISPQLFDIELWKRSGHWDLFREYMYHTKIGEKDMGFKPMNCPGHILIYSSAARSYRDLPIRFADFGRLHRSERAGVISGLTRVRSFSQDDAHIFCAPHQIGSEMDSLLKMIREVYDVFSFTDLRVSLSTRPEKALGDAALWQEAEAVLEETLNKHEMDYLMDQGEGAFYGPKIDFDVKDALERYHQLGTIQLDFTLPERFDLEYVTETGSMKRPVMIHRAILGSIERFFGVYLEHCMGDFPLWIAPVQVTVLPVSEKSLEYAQEVHQKLFDGGFRVILDDRSDKIGAKIRQAELQKIGVMLIVGEREARRGTVSVRRRFVGDLGQMKLEDLMGQLHQEITEKRRPPVSQR